MTSDQLIPAKQSTTTDSYRPRGPNWKRNKEKRDGLKAAKVAASAVSLKAPGFEASKIPTTSREKLRSSLVSKTIAAVA